MGPVRAVLTLMPAVLAGMFPRQMMRPFAAAQPGLLLGVVSGCVVRAGDALTDLGAGRRCAEEHSCGDPRRGERGGEDSISHEVIGSLLV
jgi:hypothetical protein